VRDGSELSSEDENKPVRPESNQNEPEGDSSERDDTDQEDDNDDPNHEKTSGKLDPSRFKFGKDVDKKELGKGPKWAGHKKKKKKKTDKKKKIHPKG